MGMAGRYFFVREFVSSFSKNKEGKASDIRKIHGSHKRYPWKGNVRELKNTVKRCLVVTEGGNTGLSISAVADAGII